jgi:hypothetical protein
MSAKLLAYRYVPPGFEIVVDNPDVEMGKVWRSIRGCKMCHPSL